jgi:hypothetical protein
MEQSILTSIKKLLQIPEENEEFDTDIIIHINSAFSDLHQLGLGPDDEFMIEDKTAKWADYIGSDKYIQSVKTYVYLFVRLVFDPPTTSFGQQAFKEQLREREWRLNVQREGEKWRDPTQSMTS